MKYIRILLTVTIGIIYVPLNNLYLFVQKKYLPLQKKDIVDFYLFAPFYWILALIVWIISIPYDFLIAKDLH